MLRLTNIKINGDYIEADYVPEDSNKKGHVRLGIKDDSEDGTKVEGYEFGYIRHAYNGLKDTLNDYKSGKIKELPAQRLIMWY